MDGVFGKIRLFASVTWGISGTQSQQCALSTSALELGLLVA
jgi:hypothetical protein